MNRKIAPAIHDAVTFDLHLKPYELFTLDNGVQVVAVDAGTEEVMSVEWVFNGGNWVESANMVAGATSALLKNGTHDKSAFQISEHFEYYGAYLNRNCYNETANITLHTLTKHLPELLPVVAEMITSATFPESELAIYKQNSLQRLAVSLKKCDFIANRLIDEQLYGFDHPYGKYANAPHYEALQREQLVAHYQTYYANGACIIFVAGKLPKDWFSQLNNAFGKLPLRPRHNQYPTHAVIPAAGIGQPMRVVNDEEGVQGAIRLARPMFNRHHPDFKGVQILNTVFGGFFGSRLMSNIREEKGYTYGIYSYLQNHIHDSAWVVSTEAGRDVCEAAVQEVFHEMQRLQEELIPEEELLLVRNYLMGTLLGDLDGPFQIISRWKSLLLNDLDDQFFYDSIRVIKEIDAKELQRLAQQYLQPKDFYNLIVV